MKHDVQDRVIGPDDLAEDTPTGELPAAAEQAEAQDGLDLQPDADDATGELAAPAELAEGEETCPEDGEANGEVGVSFLSSADELEGIDFGFSGSSLLSGFQAGGDEHFDDDAVLGDDTTVLPSFDDVDEATAVLDDGNDATTVLPDEGATSVLEEPKEPQKKLPIPLVAGVAAVIVVLIVAVVLFFGGAKEEKAAVGYSVAYVDQDGGELQPEEVLVGEDGETVSLTAPQPDGYKLQSVDAPSEDMVSEDGSIVTLSLADGASNKVTFHYAKIVKYKVRYLNEGTKKAVSKEKTYKDCLAGSKVKAKAPKVKGYTLSGSKEKSLQLTADNDKNVITFYYEKNAAPSTGGYGGGSSYTPSFSADAVDVG